ALDQFSVIRETSDWLVWRGYADSGERFTVKQVHPGARIPDYLAEQLTAEFDFFAKLQHPGFLAPLRWEDQGPAIHFQDTQGSLAQLLDQVGTLAVDQVANVLLQCAEALEYLHGRKMGHGSVNTRTILVAPNGTIKFGDFTGYPFDQQAPPLSPDQPPRYQ